jgi:hypothetical protein
MTSIADRENLLPERPADDNGWTEPESAASVEYPPVYPFNKVMQSDSGHMFEMDDTPGAERLRIHHRSGSFIEMHPNGDEVHKIYGDGYEIIAKNKNVLISGVCNITVEKDCLIHVKGNKKELIDGDYSLVIKGEYNVAIQGEGSIMSQDDMTVGCGNLLDGSLNIMTGSHLHLSGDLSVDGHIQGLSVAAERLDAAIGVSAGVEGIFSLGPITSLLSVEAPNGTFGIMDAVLMTDVVNTALHNCHFHISKFGPTTPPIPKMI